MFNVSLTRKPVLGQDCASRINYQDEDRVVVAYQPWTAILPLNQQHLLFWERPSHHESMARQPRWQLFDQAQTLFHRVGAYHTEVHQEKTLKECGFILVA